MPPGRRARRPRTRRGRRAHCSRGGAYASGFCTLSESDQGLQAGLKDPKAARFTHTESGSKGFCFMRMHADAAAPRGAPAVTKLVHAALTRARDSGQGRAKCVVNGACAW